MSRLRRLLLRGARGVLFGYAALLVALPAGDRLQQSSVEFASSGFAFDLLAFEFGNFFDKWAYRVLTLAPWVDDGPEARADALAQYESLARRFRENNAALERATAQGSETLLAEAQSERARLEAERNDVRNLTEEHLEAELSLTLAQRGFGGRGDFLWPPVDFRIDDTPSILVTSERDVIRRREGRLLDSYLTDEDKLAIEDQLLREADLSAVVLRTGGLAAFPNIVPSHYDLLPLLEVSAHEWLHAYLLFHPLGRAYWSSGDMTSLNETLAQLFGTEIGRITYNRLTGADIDPLEPPPGVDDDDDAPPDPELPDDPDRFDFREFMFETRQRSDELLARGMVDDAEAYMEQRRLELVSRGYNIRKLNQAYFAFHGAYALGSSSTSPLGRQLWELRQQSDGIGDLVELLQPLADYGQFLELLDDRGVDR